MRIKYRYGWKRDLPDRRDHKYERKFKLFLPQQVDLRPQCPPIVDQGNLGSCTANALAGCFDFLELRDSKTPYVSSRLFIYYNERVLEGDVDQDAGALIRDGIKSLAKWGVCPESDWIYDISQFAVKPPDACYQEASNHQILEYQRLSGLSDVYNALANGLPVVYGISVFESFELETTLATGIVPDPSSDETMLGGHAMVLVGYDLAARTFISRNSWGDKVGQAGYFILPTDYVEKSGSDFWVIQKEETDEADSGSASGGNVSVKRGCCLCRYFRRQTARHN